MKTTHDLRTSFHPRRLKERGVIMIIALLTLAIMMVGAVAAIRSMNVSLASVGNLGFKRDMANSAEQALRQVRDTMRTGSLATEASRLTTNNALNYSAAMLPTSPEGIPQAMLTMSNSDAGVYRTLNGRGVAGNQIDVTQNGVVSVSLHYLIERMCRNEGEVSMETCQTVGASPMGGGCKGPECVETPPQPLYRVTVRATGPRNTQSFFQATYTAP